MLERSVGLDPGYAPAWSALGQRIYYDFVYGSSLNDPAAHARALAAKRPGVHRDPRRGDP